MRLLTLPLVLLCTFSLAACPDDPGPTGPVEEICGDNIDNDNDGQKDCDDSECANLFECKNPTLDGGAVHDAGPVVDTGSSAPADAGTSAPPLDAGTTAGTDASQQAEICDDDIDNDGDLMTDCADPDCFGVGDCPRGPEDCGDQEDNNGDNLVDCDDPLCAGDPDCGGDPVGVPCPDVLMCLQTCPDDGCRADCIGTGTETAVRLAQAVITCDAANQCNADLACLSEHCGDELTACQNDMPG